MDWENRLVRYLLYLWVQTVERFHFKQTFEFNGLCSEIPQNWPTNTHVMQPNRALSLLYRENQSTLLLNVNWQKSDWNATIDNLSWLFYVERVTMKIRLSTKVRWSKTNYFDKKTKLAKRNVELHAWLIYLFLSLIKRREKTTRTIMDVRQASNGHQS